MALGKTIKRELEVAFSKHSQPIWFRVLKYILLGVILFFFWGTELLWIILLITLRLPCFYIFGTGIKHIAGQKVMAFGNMRKTEQTLSNKTVDGWSPMLAGKRIIIR